MYLHRLTLQDFRNYESLTLGLSTGLTLVVGPNAQGKSNLLEAMAVLAYGQSPRTPQAADLVRWGAGHARVTGEVQHATGEMHLGVALNAQGRRKLTVNAQPVRRMADYVGRLPAVYFGIEDLGMVRGAPAERRKFLDRLLSQMSSRYFAGLQQYNKVLQQRNAWLRGVADGGRYDPTMAEMWREQLATAGGLLIAHRLRLLRQLELWAIDAHTLIAGAPEPLSLRYEMAESATLPDADSAAEHLRRVLEGLAGRERGRGQTLAGPHRDDLLVLLSGREARRYASQGQQRSLVLAMKLAEVLLLRAVREEAPLLLLDDVFAELDRERQLRLLAAVPADVQTVITATEPPDAVAGRLATVIAVAAGQVTGVTRC